MIECNNVFCKNKGVFTCKRCLIIKYCSEECQKEDWKNHKLLCGKYSMTKIEGHTLSLLEQDEMMKNPPINISAKNFTELQVKIRQKLCESIFNLKMKTYPIETREMYKKYPSYKFYIDVENRPIRCFGIYTYKTIDQTMHTITLDTNGETYFTLGGTHPDLLRQINKWEKNHLELIERSDKSAIFLDPIGHEFCNNLAAQTGYDNFSSSICECCATRKIKISTEKSIHTNEQIIMMHSYNKN